MCIRDRPRQPPIDSAGSVSTNSRVIVPTTRSATPRVASSTRIPAPCGVSATKAGSLWSVVVITVVSSGRGVRHEEQRQADEEDEHAGVDGEPPAGVFPHRLYRARPFPTLHPLHDLPPGLAPFADSVT